MHDDGAVTLVNSRDVAEAFDKEHSNIMRDIRGLEMSSDLKTSWFRETSMPDSYGRPQPSVEMTRDGFTILVMGWTEDG